MRILFVLPRRILFFYNPVTDLIHCLKDAGNEVEVAAWRALGHTPFRWEKHHIRVRVPLHEFQSETTESWLRQRERIVGSLRYGAPKIAAYVSSARARLVSVWNSVTNGFFASIDRIGLKRSYARWRPYHGNSLAHWLTDQVEHGKYDIVVAVEAEALVLAAEALAPSGPPLVYYSLEIVRHRSPTLKYYERAYAATAELLIIQDEDRGGVLQGDLGLENPRFFFLPYAPAGKSQVLPSSVLREHFGLPPDTKMVTQIGSIYSLRSSDRIARIANRLPPDHVIVFHSGLHIPLSEIIEGESLRNARVSETPYPPEEMPGIYASSHIGIVFYNEQDVNQLYTSYSSYQLTAYLRCGVPIIAKKNPPWQKAVARFGFGVCVEGAEQIPDAVREINSHYNRFSDNARRAFETHYNLNLHVPALVAMFAKTIAGSRRT